MRSPAHHRPGPHRPPWPRLAAAALGVGVAGLGGRLAVPAPAPSPPTVAARGGYWLGVDLVGPAAAQQAAAAELAAGLPMREPVDLAPPGLLVGHVADVQEALRWIDDHAFEPRPRLPPHPLALQRVPAPAPAGGLLERHAAVLAAFIVSGATAELQPRTIEWPLDQAEVLPNGSTWIPAALVPAHAPLFSAPAPRVPPAAERHAMARRRGGLFVLSWIDRCTDEPTGLHCLRWAQVVARDGDRFTPGYLPMFQVASSADWVRGEGALPRAQLVPIAIVADQAQWVLLARARDNQLHRRTLQAPADAHGWPRASLQVEGDDALVALGDQPVLRLALDATLDARPPRSATSDDEDEEH